MESQVEGCADSLTVHRVERAAVQDIQGREEARAVLVAVVNAMAKILRKAPMRLDTRSEELELPSYSERDLKIPGDRCDPFI